MNFKVTKNFRPLLSVGDKVYAWSGCELFLFSGNQTHLLIKRYKKNLFYYLLQKLPLMTRVLREGLHDLLLLENGSMVAISKGGIVYSGKDELDFKVVHKINRGSRPLSLCNGDLAIYYGEYFNNKNRGPVGIYKSIDGIKWELAYEFSPGEIRHIHGIIFDKYRGGMWVLTGDSDEESGLWFTSDNFKTLERCFFGSQTTRAVSVIPVESGLIVPMDSPLEKNYISYFDLQSKTIRQLKEVNSSVFFAQEVGGVFFASTAAEPSDVNDDKNVHLYASLDGYKWHELISFERDMLSSFSDRFFQYPSLAIAKSFSGEKLYLYARSVKSIDNSMIEVCVESVRDNLSKKETIS